MREPAEAEKNGPRMGVPRWPAAVALLSVGPVYAVVSDGLSLGPRLLAPVLILFLVIALMGAHLAGRHLLARRFALVLVRW